MATNIFNDLREFNKKFDFKIGDNPVEYEKNMAFRRSLLAEELDELDEALDLGIMSDIIDAYLDIIYIVAGTITQLDVIDPETAWNIVHSANMQKERGVKETRPDSDGYDVIKPDGWEDPNSKLEEEITKYIKNIKDKKNRSIKPIELNMDDDKRPDNKEFIKHDSDKPRIDLIPSEALFGIARILTFGAKKYGAYNWANGSDWSRYYSAAQRHLLSWNMGEDYDSETGENHLYHALCCLVFLITYVERDLGTDNRQKV